MKEPQQITLRGLDIEALEKAIYLRDGTGPSYEECTKQLHAALLQVRQGSSFFGSTNDEMLRLYSRLAAAITALFTDPKFGLTEPGYQILCAQHTVIHSVFQASIYRTADHILSIIGKRHADDPRNMDFGGDVIYKLLLCWSLESEVRIDWDAMLRFAPGPTAWAIIGILSIGGTISERAYDNRLALMRLLPHMEEIDFPEYMISSLGDLYMHCSYVADDAKHEVKAVINRMLRRLVEKRATIPEVPKGCVRKVRPTIVVPLEWFGSYHAMYRCYAPALRSLRERFRVVGMVLPSNIDAEGRDVFDKVIDMDDGAPSLDRIARQILDEAPDMIYYPSLGMASWWVALSNFRLAPVQVISPGHPASSHSPVIDYIVSDGDLFGDPRHYSEELVGLPIGTFRYAPRQDSALPQGIKREWNRLAIPAMMVKITPPFLRVLRRIKDRNPSIVFDFFPNMVGTAHIVVERQLKEWFPDCTVHPRSSYYDYMGALGRCQAMLSTFPFGGTNSVIDAFLCRIPVITLEGDQIHSRSDASMIRRMKLPDGLIAHNEDEYVNAAISAAQYGLTFNSKIVVEQEFFGDPPEHLRGAILDAFNDLYERNIR